MACVLYKNFKSFNFLMKLFNFFQAVKMFSNLSKYGMQFLAFNSVMHS